VTHCDFSDICDICESNGWREKLESLMKEGGLQGVSSTNNNGVEFCRYVLEWYYKRGLNAELLDVGTFSPTTLATFLEGKNELKWMNDLREERYGDCANCLLKIGNGKSGVEDRKLWLSLAKLTGLAAGENSEAGIRAGDGLVSVYGQEMIGGCGSEALDFIQLALAASGKLKDTPFDDRIRNVMVGLSTSEIVRKSDVEKGESLAKIMWLAVIECERSTWTKLSKDRSSLADEELESLLRETLLFNALRIYGGESDIFELKGERLEVIAKEGKGKGVWDGGLVKICVGLLREEADNDMQM